MRHRFFQLAVVLVLSGLAQGFIARSGVAQEPESTRSWPPDTTPYARPAVPEDYAPDERGAFPPAAFIVDAVVNNTDPNLTNTDTFNDGETSIAVNPENPNEIVISAFSGSWGANSPIWHSTDGGLTWTKRFTVPAPPGRPAAIGCPCDQAFDYGGSAQLSGTFLADEVYTGTTTNPANAASWNWNAPGGVTQATNINALGNPDQPWLLVNRDPTTASQDNVYVAYDDFNNGDGIDGPDMRVSVSYGANPPNFTVDNQTGNSLGFVNPGHRLAVDRRTGFLYSLFQRCVSSPCTSATNPKNVDYMLNRSTDGGATWTLNGSATGIVVANADSTQPQPKFGTVNALLGGVLHAAVDPNTGDLYYVYGNRDSVTGNNRLALRRIQGDGAGGVIVGPETFVTGQVQAAIPSVAVASDGTVSVFHYTFEGFSSDSFPIFTAHLALSQDQGGTFADRRLLTFLSSAMDDGTSRQRVLGDYMQMKTVGRTFYGAFTGNGVPFGRPFANHDPIFFRVSVGPRISVNPGSLDFGLVPVNPVGGESGHGSRDFNICNVGTTDLVVTNARLEAPNSAFAIIPPPPGGFPLPISPDFCHTIEVQFNPVASGLTTATVRIESDDPDDPVVLAPSLAGTGAVPVIQVSPGTLSFGNVPTNPVGGEIGFADRSLRVRNQGTSNLQVSDIAAVGGSFADFTVLTPTPGFPVIISPDAEFDFQIRCDPSKAGTRSTLIRVTSNSGGAPGTITDVNADCAGTVPDIEVTGALDFGKLTGNEIKDLAIQTHNTGNSNLSLTKIALTGDPAFTIQGAPTLPFILSPNAQAQITVRCDINGPAGIMTATLTIESNDPDESSVMVPASCRKGMGP